jgi:hypothetical protein
MTHSSIRAVSALMAVALLSSCSSSPTTTTTTTTTNAYALAYQSATYNNGTTGNMTVSFPSSCSMTVTGTGVPYQHQVYYLAPTGNGGTTVATTPSGIQLQLIAYAGTGLSTSVKTVSATFNTCPTKATSTTATGMGAIGLMFSGTVLFNPYEATSTVALSDNASYTFASTACGGTTCTASFIDPCNQHTAGGTGGSTWHFHGVPTCWTSFRDGAGPSHIIGIALDGYPIYGGYDINGNAVSVGVAGRMQRHHERHAGVPQRRVPLCAAGEYDDEAVVDQLLYRHGKRDALRADEEARVQDALPARRRQCAPAGWPRGLARAKRTSG